MTVARSAYGNWIQHKSPGIAGAGLLGTVVLLVGLVSCLLALLIGGLALALPVAAVTLVLFGAVGSPLGHYVGRRYTFWRQRSARAHQWRSGVFSFNKNPSTRLPGMLGRTTLLSKTDAFGNEFAVIKNPRARGLYTVVARAMAEGPWMQDQGRVNDWVSGYAGLLSACGREPGLVCAKAITDTAPDAGGRLGEMVTSLRDHEAAPAMATAIMTECVQDYPAASSENVTYFEMTFRGRALSRKNDESVILSELARRVPGMLGHLQQAGGGSVDMLTREELPKVIRAGYDPASAPWMEQAELAGIAESVTWKEAGPVADQAGWDSYRHDSGLSVTWEMQSAPRAAIHELAMSGLLSPHSDFTRKRIALIYRPHTPEGSVKISENDATTARFSAGQTSKRITASADLRMQATEQSRREVASGASLVRFSVLVTGTVTDAEDLPQAVATIESRAGATPIRLRRCYGSQAAAFAATLPVGFVPWEHTVIPTEVRELM